MATSGSKQLDEVLGCFAWWAIATTRLVEYVEGLHGTRYAGQMVSLQQVQEALVNAGYDELASRIGRLNEDVETQARRSAVLGKVEALLTFDKLHEAEQFAPPGMESSSVLEAIYKELQTLQPVDEK